MIGWGLSDKPEAFSYSLFQQADVAEALLKSLGISEAHVASHDLGTSVHTELLARNLEGSLSFKLLSSLITDGSILQWISNEPASQNLAQSNETLFLAMEKTTPLRIAWAKDDPVATVNIGRELAQRCPQAEYVEIGGVGHFPNAEDPDFVAEQVALSAGLSYTASK